MNGRHLMAVAALFAAVFALAVWAGEDASQYEYVTIANPIAYTNNQAYSTLTNAVDIGKYKGIGEVLVYSSADLTLVPCTNADIVLQHATDTTGSFSSAAAYCTIADGNATGQTQNVQIDLSAVHRYLRLAVNLEGTAAVKRVIGAVLVAPHMAD